MYESEVAKGSAWLDRMNPGWYKKINIDALALGRYERCSLGQTFGANVSMNLCADINFSGPHGFIIRCSPHTEKPFLRSPRWRKFTDEEHDKEYKLLTGAWIQEILRRREMDRMTEQATNTVEQS